MSLSACRALLVGLKAVILIRFGSWFPSKYDIVISLWLKFRWLASRYRRRLFSWFRISARGPPQHHPHRLRPRRTPRTPLTHRTGPRPTTHDHHTSPAHSGTPAWGKTTAEQPGPPSCPGGHTVKFGACVYRTARVGYCFMFRVLVVNSFTYLMRSECCFMQ